MYFLQRLAYENYSQKKIFKLEWLYIKTSSSKILKTLTSCFLWNEQNTSGHLERNQKQARMYIKTSTDEIFMAVAFWLSWNKKHVLWKCTFHHRTIGSCLLYKTFFRITNSSYPVVFSMTNYPWDYWIKTNQISENNDFILNIALNF